MVKNVVFQKRVSKNIILLCLLFFAVLLSAFFGANFANSKSKVLATDGVTFSTNWQSGLSGAGVTSAKINSISFESTAPDTQVYSISTFVGTSGTTATDQNVIDTNVGLKLFAKQNDSVFDCIVAPTTPNTTIFAPINCSNLFANFSNTKKIILENFNTTNTTNMSKMFYGKGGFIASSALAEIQFSANFVTNKVVSMDGMFGYCMALKKIDVSNFDTTNVTNISEMFVMDSSLSILNLSNFNLNNITNYDNFISSTTFGQIKTPSAMPSGVTIPLCTYTSGNATFYIDYYESGSSTAITQLDSTNTGKTLSAKCNFSLSLGGGTTTNTTYQTTGFMFGDTYTFSTLPVKAEMVKTGYNFVGWYNDSALTSQITGDFALDGSFSSGTFVKTLYAKWEAKTYNVLLCVSYDQQNGSYYGTTDITKTTVATYNQIPSNIDITDIVAPTGLLFKGFYTQKNGAGTQIFDATGNGKSVWTIDLNGTTIYAKYDYQDYTFAFDSNGGKFADDTSQKSKDITYLSTLKALSNDFSPTRANYSFAGYYTLDNQKYYNLDLTPAKTKSDVAGNISLYAKWEAKVYKITLTVADDKIATLGTSEIFEKYGIGFYTNDSCTTILTTVEVPTIINDLYIFASFEFAKTNALCIEKDGTIKISNTNFESAESLVATFTNKEFAITFDANGGTLTRTRATLSWGKTFLLSGAETPKMGMYKFVGWSKTADGEILTDDNFIMPQNDVTLYAIYKLDVAMVVLISLAGVVVLFLGANLMIAIAKKRRRETKKMTLSTDFVNEQKAEKQVAQIDETTSKKPVPKIDLKKVKEYKSDKKHFL